MMLPTGFSNLKIFKFINYLWQKESIYAIENYFNWVQKSQNVNFSLRIYKVISNDNLILFIEQKQLKSV